MFGVEVHKNMQSAEKSVFGFIINHFSDPFPGFPLSKQVLTRIFHSQFLDQLINYSNDIAEGYEPAQESVLQLLKSNQIKLFSLQTLILMIGRFKSGINIPIEEIERHRLDYGYNQRVRSTQEYRTLEYYETMFVRIINYISEA